VRCQPTPGRHDNRALTGYADLGMAEARRVRAWIAMLR
jgi:hypothetical protein